LGNGCGCRGLLAACADTKDCCLTLDALRTCLMIARNVWISSKQLAQQPSSVVEAPTTKSAGMAYKRLHLQQLQAGELVTGRRRPHTPSAQGIQSKEHASHGLAVRVGGAVAGGVRAAAVWLMAHVGSVSAQPGRGSNLESHHDTPRRSSSYTFIPSCAAQVKRRRERTTHQGVLPQARSSHASQAIGSDSL
jgi:hypothetical protein